MNLWWGKIRDRDHAEQIIIHSSNVLLCIAGVLIGYGIFRGVMAPGLAWLAFGVPDGGTAGAIPGILYGSLGLLFRRLRSRLAAFGMLLGSCIMVFDHLIYHFLPIALLPTLLVLWINFRAVKATLAWHQNKPATVTVSVQKDWRSNFNQAPWFAMAGIFALFFGLGPLFDAARTEWIMSGSITAPCEIVSTHEFPPNVLIGGPYTYSVHCTFRDQGDIEQSVFGSVNRSDLDALQIGGQVQVQYLTNPPFYKRIQLTNYEWAQTFLMWGTVTTVGIILIVVGLKRKDRGGNGTSATPATTSPIAP